MGAKKRLLLKVVALFVILSFIPLAVNVDTALASKKATNGDTALALNLAGYTIASLMAFKGLANFGGYWTAVAQPLVQGGVYSGLRAADVNETISFIGAAGLTTLGFSLLRPTIIAYRTEPGGDYNLLQNAKDGYAVRPISVIADKDKWAAFKTAFTEGIKPGGNTLKDAITKTADASILRAASTVVIKDVAMATTAAGVQELGRLFVEVNTNDNYDGENPNDHEGGIRGWFRQIGKNNDLEFSDYTNLIVIDWTNWAAASAAAGVGAMVAYAGDQPLTMRFVPAADKEARQRIYKSVGYEDGQVQYKEITDPKLVPQEAGLFKQSNAVTKYVLEIVPFNEIGSGTSGNILTAVSAPFQGVASLGIGFHASHAIIPFVSQFMRTQLDNSEFFSHLNTGEGGWGGHDHSKWITGDDDDNNPLVANLIYGTSGALGDAIDQAVIGAYKADMNRGAVGALTFAKAATAGIAKTVGIAYISLGLQRWNKELDLDPVAFNALASGASSLLEGVVQTAMNNYYASADKYKNGARPDNSAVQEEVNAAAEAAATTGVNGTVYYAGEQKEKVEYTDPKTGITTIIEGDTVTTKKTGAGYTEYVYGDTSLWKNINQAFTDRSVNTMERMVTFGQGYANAGFNLYDARYYTAVNDAVRDMVSVGVLNAIQRYISSTIHYGIFDWSLEGAKKTEVPGGEVTGTATLGNRPVQEDAPRMPDNLKMRPYTPGVTDSTDPATQWNEQARTFVKYSWANADKATRRAMKKAGMDGNDDCDSLWDIAAWTLYDRNGGKVPTKAEIWAFIYEIAIYNGIPESDVDHPEMENDEQGRPFRDIAVPPPGWKPPTGPV